MTTYFHAKITSDGYDVDFENPVEIQETEYDLEKQLQRAKRFCSSFNEAVLEYEQACKETP